MILRKMVLVLALVTLLLSLVLARKKQHGSARMDQLVSSLTQMRDEQPSVFDSFLRNQHRYFLEEESERQKHRKIYQEIQQSPHPMQLENTMGRYYDWLQSQTQYQRMNHLSLSVDERIEQIQTSLNESQDEPFSRTFSPSRDGGDRGPRNFVAEDSVLKNIPDELFLTFHQTRLEQLFQEYLESLPDEAKTRITKEQNTLCALFEESPESPGIWTLSALLKLHYAGMTASNITIDTLLQGASLEQFENLLSEESREAFQNLAPDRQRVFIHFGILSSLFQKNHQSDFLKKLRTNRLSDTQERLLREVFEFLPDQEMDLIVKSPPEQFNRKIMFYLLLPANDRERMQGRRWMMGGGVPGSGPPPGGGSGGPRGRPPGDRNAPPHENGRDRPLPPPVNNETSLPAPTPFEFSTPGT